MQSAWKAEDLARLRAKLRFGQEEESAYEKGIQFNAEALQ